MKIENRFNPNELAHLLIELDYIYYLENKFYLTYKSYEVTAHYSADKIVKSNDFNLNNIHKYSAPYQKQIFDYLYNNSKVTLKNYILKNRQSMTNEIKDYLNISYSNEFKEISN